MRIGVDAACWQNNRGYGRYVRSLLTAMVRIDSTNRYTFFLDSAEQSESLPAGTAVRLVQSSSPTAVSASANGHRSLRDMWRMSRAMAARDLEVLLFPTIYSYVPVLSRAKKVVMIYDTIVERFPELTLPRRTSRWFWKAKVALGRWQASALVTISERSRRDIEEQFAVPRDRLYVVGTAQDPIFRVLPNAAPTPQLRSLGISGGRRLVVYVGGFGPHKNLEMLVDVFADAASRPEFGDVGLVLVGEYQKEVFHSCFSVIRNRVQRLGLSDRVLFTGYLPDEELVTLLNLSTVLVLPSLLEGFGLPAAEAAACGLPVIVTTASPLPEVLGDGGLFVDPLDCAGWRDALCRVLASEPLRDSMRQAGLRAAGKLTWEATARKMIDILEQVSKT